jgi:excisionase family DNA binding protein
MSEPVYLTLQEAAKRARVCKNTLRKYLHRGLPATKMGHQWRIQTVAFDAWISTGILQGPSTLKPDQVRPHPKNQTVEMVVVERR